MTTAEEKRKSSITFRQKLGYASGIVSEAVLYNMFYTFFILFLTDVAGVRPGLAGTIALFSIAWDGITDPWIGHLVDKPGADKRKFIAWAAVPMGVLFIATFSPSPFGEIGSFIYYIVITMAFWVAYTAVTVPYYALGAEITQDYDERTNIRGMSSFILTFAIIIGAGVPLILVGALADRGTPEKVGWMISAAFMACVAILFAFIIVFSLRKVPLARPSQVQKESVFKSFVSVLKIKPLRPYLFFVFFFLISSTMINGNLPFVMLHRANAQPESVTVVLVAVVIVMMAFVPIMTWIANKRDRKTAIIIAFSIEVVGLLAMKLVGLTSLTNVILVASFAGIGLAGFWTMFYSFAYDLCEIDEYMNGQRREGVITALPQLVQKLGAAIGLWLVGIALEWTAYNPDLPVQTERTGLGIENVTTLLAAGLTFLSLISMIFYPITKKRFNKLQVLLERKRNGESIEDPGFEFLK